GLHLLDEEAGPVAAEDRVVAMPPRPLENGHVAVNDRAVVEEAPLQEVVDEIVFIHEILIVAPRMKVAVRHGPDRVSGDQNPHRILKVMWHSRPADAQKTMFVPGGQNGKVATGR